MTHVNGDKEQQREGVARRYELCVLAYHLMDYQLCSAADSRGQIHYVHLYTPNMGINRAVGLSKRLQNTTHHETNIPEAGGDSGALPALHWIFWEH